MAPQAYHIQSVDTKAYIVSTTKDKDRQDVIATHGHGGIPAHTKLTASKPIEGATTSNVTFAGVTNPHLYVSLVGNGENTRLTWSSKAYDWNVSVIGNRHVVIPSNGANLYWVNDPATGPYVEVKAGGQIQGDENQWNFIKA